MINTLAEPLKTANSANSMAWDDASFDEEEEALNRAFALAVREALLDHKRAGNPVAIWEDGKVKIVQPEDIILPEESA